MLVVFFKIFAVLLTLMAGWVARRRGIFTADTMKAIGLYLILMASPCLMFLRTLGSVEAGELRREWLLPFLAVGIAALAHALASLASRRACGGERRAAFLSCVMIPNWMYLAMIVAEPLYGSAALRVILLVNLGMTVYFWTGGVMVYARERPEGHVPFVRSLGRALVNPNMLAVLGGLAVLLVWPAAKGALPGRHPADPESYTPVLMTLGMVFDAMEWIAITTIPMNFLLTGAQMGAAWQKDREAGPNRPRNGTRRQLAWVVALRLALAPLATLALMVLVVRSGWWAPGEAVFVTLAIISAMPVAVGVSMLAEVYDGDTGIVAKAIFLTTILSLATAPLMTGLARMAYPWAMGLEAPGVAG